MSDLRTVSAPTLLILGGPSSGKTTYRTQLYQRIEHEKGELRLLKPVSDMSALEADVERMVQGLQPMHTKTDVYHSTTFSIEDVANRSLTLEFADYGGEQVRRIGEGSTFPEPWIARAKQSMSWLFFLRVDNLRSAKSFMTDPVETGPPTAAIHQLGDAERSGELNAIETLQRLLFVRGASLSYPLSRPRLGLLLSCWDELLEPERKLIPARVLESRAPLFSRFIETNWAAEAIKVWGLSSTERKLPEDKPDLEFARTGPQHFGCSRLGKRPNRPRPNDTD